LGGTDVFTDWNLNPGTGNQIEETKPQDETGTRNLRIVFGPDGNPASVSQAGLLEVGKTYVVYVDASVNVSITADPALILARDPGDAMIIAREETEPAGPAQFHAEKARLSDGGHVVFTGRPGPGDSHVENGIFVYTPDVGYDTIIQSGDALTNGGTLQGIPPEFSTNDSGHVAFYAGISSDQLVPFSNADFSQGTGDTFDDWTVIDGLITIDESTDGGVDGSRAG
jgi:hypothetical protein